MRTGFEVAEEVAFYHGCTQVQLKILSSRAFVESGCIGAPLTTVVKVVNLLLRLVFHKLFFEFHRLHPAVRMHTAKNRNVFDMIACSLRRFGGASRQRPPQPFRREQARALRQ